MASNSRNEKASKASQKSTKKNVEKQKCHANSCDDRDLKSKISVSKIVEERMSPTKQTINMFEKMASQLILDVKPFAKSTGAQEGTVVLKSMLAPDVCDVPAVLGGDETEHLVSRQIEKLAKMVAEMDVCEEQVVYETCSDTEPNATNRTILESIQEDGREDTTKVTIEDLKAKIIEILDVPILSENQERVLQKDIDRMHDENMRGLKKKLRLDFESDRAVTQSAPIIGIQEKIGQFEVEISKHYKGKVKEASMQKASCRERPCILQKSEMDDAKKIFNSARSRVSKRRKSLIQCNINDLTETSVFNVNFEPHTPHLEDECQTQQSDQDMTFEDYNAERELIKMAIKEKDAPCDSRIEVTYMENKQAEEPFRLMSILERLFYCGTLI